MKEVICIPLGETLEFVGFEMWVVNSGINHECAKCYIYKKEMIYIPNVLMFLVEIWRFPLVWS
jgi:hypothetical protein